LLSNRGASLLQWGAVASTLLGIDLGTTSLRALVVGLEGAVLGQASAPYPTAQPHPGWTEQEPADWWQACCSALSDLRAQGLLAQVKAIGLTGQMHGSVFLDRRLSVLRPAILWNDQRTAAEAAEIEERVGRRRLLAFTGNPAFTGFTAPKVLWLRRHEPGLFRRLRQLLLPKDYLRLRLTGELATDVADASGTLFFNVRAREWSGEVMRLLELDEGLLPAALESPAVSGRVTASAAADLGLPQGTPVVAGAGDQAAGAVGAGAVSPGVVMVSIGTSGVVFTAAERPAVERQGRLHAFCHAAPGLWHVMGVMLSAGGSFAWLASTLSESEEHLSELAGPSPPGAGGLLFLPYLSGERTPHADPLARGAFVGLTAAHGRGDLARAVMEGVAFGLRDCLELVRALRLPIREVRLIGGGARSPLWRQIVADVFGLPILGLEAEEGPAYGATLLAGVGAGVWRDVPEACRAAVRTATRVEPQPQTARLYDDLYGRYRDLYPKLKGSFAALHDLAASAPPAGAP
jgi:xylulokinase